MASKTNVLKDPQDNLPAMEVGYWVPEEKHEIIKRYIHSSYGARRRFSVRTYVDLFSGPARIIVRDTDQFLDGGPLAAWNMAQKHDGSFTHFFVADASPEYLEAARTRLNGAGAPGRYYQGFAHETVDRVLRDLPRSGLHLVLLDPFNAGHLHFSIIEKLAKLENIDIVVHLSTSDIQRNIDEGFATGKSTLNNFAPGWQDAIRQIGSRREMQQKFIDYWAGLVGNTGLKVCDEKYAVKNSKESRMYHLCLLSRHDLANKLWTAACKIDPTRSMFPGM